MENLEKLLEEVRVWNQEWERYDRKPSLPKPLSHAAFILELEEKYEVLIK